MHLIVPPLRPTL